MYPHPYGGYAPGAAALTQALTCPIPGMAAFYRRCSDRVTQLSFAMHTVKTKFPAAAGRPIVSGRAQKEEDAADFIISGSGKPRPLKYNTRPPGRKWYLWTKILPEFKI
jgi:hypothetical protein